jgi:hypothetical protein
MRRINLPIQVNRKVIHANRKNPPIDALMKRDPPPVDLLRIREEVIDYLKHDTKALQVDIAGIVGIRREMISAIRQGRAALTDIVDLQRLYAWMCIDRKQNGSA